MPIEFLNDRQGRRPICHSLDAYVHQQHVDHFVSSPILTLQTLRRGLTVIVDRAEFDSKLSDMAETEPPIFALSCLTVDLKCIYLWMSHLVSFADEN